MISLNDYPDLTVLTKDVQLHDLVIALVHVEAFLRYVEPFVPVTLYAEYHRTRADVERALKAAA